MHLVTAKGVLWHAAGFRLNFASPGMWGRGCYFSVTANLSCQNYAYSMPAAKAVAYGGKDVSQVMLVKVLVGSAYHSSPDKSLKIPPLVQDIPEHLRCVPCVVSFVQAD